MIRPKKTAAERLWGIRYFLLSAFDEARWDDDGMGALTPEVHALDMAKKISGSLVLDACSGLGGNTIAFAREGKFVSALETDKSRVENARHNAGLYGREVSDRINFYHSSVVDFARASCSHYDAVFLDPPWGAKPGEYKKREKITLSDMSLGQSHLREVIRDISCSEVLIKVPSNYDFSSFSHITPSAITEYCGCDGRHIFSGVVMSKAEFLVTPS